MTVGELVDELSYVKSACGLQGVDLRFELEWVFADFCVSIWSDDVVVAKHLPVVNNFEHVWAWLGVNYPEFDWVD
jgi:hypothetical protein